MGQIISFLNSAGKLLILIFKLVALGLYLFILFGAPFLAYKKGKQRADQRGDDESLAPLLYAGTAFIVAAVVVFGLFQMLLGDKGLDFVSLLSQFTGRGGGGS
jgi:hypothetical protein